MYHAPVCTCLVPFSAVPSFVLTPWLVLCRVLTPRSRVSAPRRRAASSLRVFSPLKPNRRFGGTFARRHDQPARAQTPAGTLDTRSGDAARVVCRSDLRRRCRLGSPRTRQPNACVAACVAAAAAGRARRGGGRERRRCVRGSKLVRHFGVLRRRHSGHIASRAAPG